MRVLQRLIKQLLNNALIRNIFSLSLGTFLAQLIPLLSLPLLTRLYTPDQFGILGYIVAIYSLTSTLGCMRLDQAVLVQNTNRDVQYLLHGVFIVSGILSIIIFLLPYMGFLFSFKTSWLNYVAFFTFFSSMNLILISYFIRHKRFVRTSIGKIITYSSIVLCQITFGYIGVVDGLIVGQLIGIIIGFSFYSSYMINIKNSFIKYFKFTPIINLIKLNKKFPIYSLPLSLMNGISRNLPNFLLLTLYDPKVAGFYILANRISLAPVALISSAVGQVFYQKAAAMERNNSNAYQLFRKVYIAHWGIGLIPAIIIFFLLPDIFLFIFGAEWVDAGIYAQIMLPWVFLVFVNTSLMGSINVKGQQKTLFYFELILLILRMFSFIAAYLMGFSAVELLILYSLIGFVMQLYLSYFMFKIMKDPNNA